MSVRRPGTRVAALLLAGVLSVLALAGCGGTGGLHHFRGRAELVDNLASWLDRYQASPFRADYRLADGSAATVARTDTPPGTLDPKQKPARPGIAYQFPGDARYILTPWRLITCTGAAGRTCTAVKQVTVLTAQPDSATIRRLSGDRYLTVEEVMSLVTGAAQDDRTTLTTSDRTIAGQSAHCVAAASSERSFHPFTACVTHRGVLASFVGRVDGHDLALTMTRFQRSPVGVSFRVPVGSRTIDHRPSA